MELWVRSQNKGTLMKVNRIDVEDNNVICYDNDYYCNKTYMGLYKSKERALKILDEISNKIKNQYIIKANCLIKPSDMMKEKEYLENTYDGDFIMQPSAYEIEPINPHVIYFEMPSE